MFKIQGNYMLRKYVLNQSKMPEGIPPGKYLLKMTLMETAKIIFYIGIKIDVK